MAGKQSTIFSTNPKMDTSGISATKPRYGYMGQELTPEKISGGDMYKEAICESETGAGKANPLSSNANMKKAAGFISQGLSPDHAFDVVGKEVLHMPDSVDVLKSVVKMVKGKK